MNIRKWLSFVLVAVMLSTACVASAATSLRASMKRLHKALVARLP